MWLLTTAAVFDAPVEELVDLVEIGRQRRQIGPRRGWSSGAPHHWRA